MNRKKLFSALAAICLVSSLAACSNSSTAARSETKPEKTKADTAKVPHWSYEGEAGPEKWGSLDPGFAKCADGREQSPIDIELANVKVDKTVENPTINYQPAPMTVMNNGHTIQINDPSGTNSIILDGKEYKLVQMHFHKPSENQINGQNFMMEVHLVHKNSEGGLAVIGLLIKEGKENQQLAEIWEKLPKKVTKEDVKLANPVDLINLLPADKKSFRYNGSLTTPPCTEGVKWTVFETPIEMSKEQIAKFGAIFHENNRPVQPLNDRQVVSN